MYHSVLVMMSDIEEETPCYSLETTTHRSTFSEHRSLFCSVFYATGGQW